MANASASRSAVISKSGLKQKSTRSVKKVSKERTVVERRPERSAPTPAPSQVNDVPAIPMPMMGCARRSTGSLLSEIVAPVMGSFRSDMFKRALGAVSESVSGIRQRVAAAAEALRADSKSAQDEITFSPLTKENLVQVQAFFKFHDMDGPTRATDPRKWVMVAYVKDFMVGAIMCNVSKTKDAPCRVYIDALAVFKPYRRLALGKKLVEWVLNKVSEVGPGQVRDVYLHTPACFLSAHRFYQRLGFKEMKRIPNYYTKLDGDHSHEAVVFSREFL